jgi:integrase
MEHAVRIDTATGRRHLKPRREPYWHRVSAGAALGYRVLEDGRGTWIAKWRPAYGQRKYHALGELADFDTALKAALAWFKVCDGGGAPEVATVREACERHVKAIRAAEGERKAAETAARFERLVYGAPIARIALHKLRPADVESWRSELAKTPARVTRTKKKGAEQVYRPRSPATVNRDLVPLRAALNRARDDGLVLTDLAWRVKLRPSKGAGVRRDIYLDARERRALIDEADASIQPFLRALAALPLRPGAVAALTVADFDKRLRSLRIGKDKAGGERRITLPPATADLLSEASRKKLPTAPLFSRPDGRAWDKDSWKVPIKEAVTAAELPAATTAYTVRHSVITDLVHDGLDLLTVAQISGTSVAMIERHYGHLRQDRAAAALARLTS